MLRLRACHGFALLVACAGCGTRGEATAPDRQRERPAALSAYDDGDTHGHVTARVVCDDASWVDVITAGRGDDAARLCEATVRRVVGRRVGCRVRTCSQEKLGPAPEVRRDATILRHTTPAAMLDVLLEAVEARRPADDMTGVVHAHVVFARGDDCAAQADALTRRARETAEEDSRAWTETSIQQLELQRARTHEELAELQQRFGGSVEAHVAKLEADYARATREADRERIRRAFADAHVAALAEARLLTLAKQNDMMLETMRAPHVVTPLETAACFTPRPGRTAPDLPVTTAPAAPR